MIDVLIVVFTGVLAPRIPAEVGVPIEGSSFFSINRRCFDNHRVHDGYANRGEFYKRAYIDATAIATHAQKWPQYGTDSSDLYFGKGTESSSFAKEIIGMPNKLSFYDLDYSLLARKENIKVAADWNHPRWGFDPYIVSQFLFSLSFTSLGNLTFVNLLRS